MEHEYNFRILLAGDGAVGKTCLLARLLDIDDRTEEDWRYSPTVFDNHSITFRTPVESETIHMEFWDTAGQEDHEQLRTMCYPGTDIYVVVYSAAEHGSLNNVLHKWIPEIRKYRGYEKEMRVILCATKSDLETYNSATVEDAHTAAEEIEAVAFVITSSKTGDGIEELKQTIIAQALAKAAGEAPKAFSPIKRKSTFDSHLAGWIPTVSMQFKWSYGNHLLHDMAYVNPARWTDWLSADDITAQLRNETRPVWLQARGVAQPSQRVRALVHDLTAQPMSSADAIAKVQNVSAEHDAMHIERLREVHAGSDWRTALDEDLRSISRVYSVGQPLSFKWMYGDFAYQGLAYNDPLRWSKWDLPDVCIARIQGITRPVYLLVRGLEPGMEVSEQSQTAGEAIQVIRAAVEHNRSVRAN